MSTWKNRIVRYEDVDPTTLQANSKNWRMHPKAQQMALTGVLSEIGIVQNVIVNERTGLLVDGHLRVAMAVKHEQPLVPVTYVDLTEAEEAAILATLDPLSALAESDNDKLGELLGQFSFESDAVSQMLSDFSNAQGMFEDEPESMEQMAEKHPEPTEDTFWPSINVRVPPQTLQLYKSLQDQLNGSDESMKFVDLVNRAAQTL